ncbi:hypothetical protein [Nitrososphaeria virus YSH_1032793]|uniref:Uncharacterized protein n=1 Tax=Nitrososphaeria virus YSH_1032793 TaxID=3071320 RepID=A0A976YDS4_9CAUD|nr:hypothetical protein QKV91_gp39 [Yangshan Harbor Nitrososphaeria virus]UVF62243.1 hypothetical protein [Nitrososphaeria virus YSH_1032793]
MVILKTHVGKNQLYKVTCSVPLPRFNKQNNGVSKLVTFGDLRPSEVLKVAVFYQQQNSQLEHINQILKDRVEELNKKITDSSFDEIEDIVSDYNDKTKSSEDSI